MTATEIRPYPVSQTVVMRSTLFALANMGATLQTYNEETGVIVATVSRWMGLQKKEVVARVRGFEQTSQLEIDAPDPEKAAEIIRMVNTYVRDGGRIQANATMQWVDLARQQEQRAKRQELTGKAKAMISGAAPPETTAVVPAQTAALTALPDGDPAQPVSMTSPVYIPDNPGVLVKNRQNMVVELKVDPAVFTDRTSYLVTCSVCQATALRGSAYCPNCGRPLTLEAVQPEMRKSAEGSASSAFRWGLAAIAFNIVPLAILVLPVLLQPEGGSLIDQIRASLTPLMIALATALGLLPAIVSGVTALRRAQRASWYQNLPAAVQTHGESRSAVGNALGWLGIYIAIAWIILIVIALV